MSLHRSFHLNAITVIRCYKIWADKQDDEQDNERIRHPRLIVEVLSPSTEAIDRGKKLKMYRSLPTLEEYVLVNSEQYFVEIYRRAGEMWTYHTFGPGEQVMLTSIDVHIPIEAL